MKPLTFRITPPGDSTKIWSAFRAKVSAMGGFVEEQLSRALTALVAATARWQSVATQDYKVNGMEVSIDEECSRILATRPGRGRSAHDRRHHQGHHRSERIGMSARRLR